MAHETTERHRPDTQVRGISLIGKHLSWEQVDEVSNTSFPTSLPLSPIAGHAALNRETEARYLQGQPICSPVA